MKMNGSTAAVRSPPTSPINKALYNFAAALSPVRLKHDSIPYDVLAEKVKQEIQARPALWRRFSSLASQSSSSNNVLQKSPNALNGMKNNHGSSSSLHFDFGDDEDSRMSMGSSETPSYDGEGNNSRSGTAARRGGGGPSQPSSSSATAPTANVSYKKSCRVRRVQELRESRRKANAVADYHPFSCTEDELPDVFGEWYQALLDDVATSTTPSKAKNLIINSLKEFFDTKTYLSNGMNLAMQFLRDFVLISFDAMGEEYKTNGKDTSRRLRETQLQVLIELFLIHSRLNTKSDMEQELTDVLKKAQFIFIAGGSSILRQFLEEDLCDCFAHLMPTWIVFLLNELSMPIPLDLEEYDTEENKYDDGIYPIIARINSRNNADLDALLDEVADERPTAKANGRNGSAAAIGAVRRGSRKPSTSSGSSVRTTSNNNVVVTFDVPKSPSRNAEVSASFVEENFGSANGAATEPRACLKRKSTNDLIGGPPRARARVIPETPEEKLLQAARVKHEPEDVQESVVKQTPMGKLRGVSSRRASRRLTELVKLSEERTRPQRMAADAARSSCRAIIQESAVAPSSSRESLLGTPSPCASRTRRPAARMNLASRLAAVHDEGGAKSTTPTSTRGTRSVTAAAAMAASQVSTTGNTPMSSRRQSQLAAASSSSVQATPEKKSRGGARYAQYCNGQLSPAKAKDHPNAMPCASPPKTYAYDITKDHLTKYKQRMKEVVKVASRDGIDEEAIYDRGMSRTNITEVVGSADTSAATAPSTSTPTTELSPSSQKQHMQKNRTGRNIAPAVNIFMAHVLLNVHNPKPLEETKLPRRNGSPQKLQKMVKVIRSKKQKRMRDRCKRQHMALHGGSPASSSQNSNENGQNATPPVEVVDDVVVDVEEEQ